MIPPSIVPPHCTTGLAGAENAEIPPGGAVAVFAQGPVGLCATMMARLLGAGLVIAVESKPDRKALAQNTFKKTVAICAAWVRQKTDAEM